MHIFPLGAVCVYVCVHHINRSGLNLMIIHLEKQNAVADPVRDLLDRNKKEPPRGTNYKTNANKNNSPRSEVRNTQSSGKRQSTTETKNRKSKRDDNRHERSRTLSRGAGRNVVLAMERDAKWRSNHSSYRRRGRESKTSFKQGN